MKINDKSLISYASTESEFDKKGYLNKKGELNHSYKRRWFVLKGNLLFYFEQPGKTPLGMIVIENCSIEVNDADRFSFCIRYQAENLTSNSRAYILCADSESDMEQWIRSLASTSYMFIAMVVAEFQKTLLGFKTDNDFNSQSKKNSGNIDSSIKKKNSFRFTSSSIFSTSNDDSVLRTRTATAKPLNININKTDMFTVTHNPKNKTKYKTLDTVRRTKSTENIHKIGNLQIDCPQNRKNGLAYNSNNNFCGDFIYKNDKTTFEFLHDKYGAAIWTRIGETL
nr:sesquipedalian-1 [Hydra vulgaris]